VILRPPTITKTDINLVVEAYEDWPSDEPVYPEDVRRWFGRYAGRDLAMIDDKLVPLEKGLIGEVDGQPVGFIVYQKGWFSAKVYQIVVPLRLRGNGYGSAMWRAIWALLQSEGVVVCDFDALPGPVAELVNSGRFVKTGEGVGAATGLPVMKGRATMGMDI